jgi:hypothetical protein
MASYEGTLLSISSCEHGNSMSIGPSTSSAPALGDPPCELTILRRMLEPVRNRLDTGATHALEQLSKMLDREPAAAEEDQRHEELIEGILAIRQADKRDKHRR